MTLLPSLIAGTPEGADALYLADQLATCDGPLVFIARDGLRMQSMQRVMRKIMPNLVMIELPAWDCLPYDRVSPRRDIMAARLKALHDLTRQASETSCLVLTTSNAVIQRLPGLDSISDTVMRLEVGKRINREQLTGTLLLGGYQRVTTVVDTGDFAVRGGLIDIFPAGNDKPCRIDLFGDDIDTIRQFDPLSQRSEDRIQQISIMPVSEVSLDPQSIERFCDGYRRHFGTAVADPLYESVKEGRPFAGMEHWLPLFRQDMLTLFDCLPTQTPIIFDQRLMDSIEGRLHAVGEQFSSRQEALTHKGLLTGAPYRPLPPDLLYLSEQAFEAAIKSHDLRQLDSLIPAETPTAYRDMWSMNARLGRDFGAERSQRDGGLLNAVVGHIRDQENQGRTVILAAHTEGSADRLKLLLSDNGIGEIRKVDKWSDVLKADVPGVLVLPIERGFVTTRLALISETDIFGDRLSRVSRKKKSKKRDIADLTTLHEGDFVVHTQHGIGRYDGLVTTSAAGAPKDCLRLVYHGEDKLFLPVENLDLLSRYGSAGDEVQVDKLGGAGWQNRKARVKKRITDMADKLIALAAERATRTGEKLLPSAGAYDEFCARFPYDETDDQLEAIEATLTDLSSGRPMDRLVCGDVGFGKTEVAMRAAFVAAMSGKQVAIMAPTTLLVRQHFRVFSERFQGFPLKIAQLSRLVTGKDAKDVREGLAKGEIDVVIGTHALLGKQVTFDRLGLVIIDEEQHFGVKHKEQLKELSKGVHLLTLTATPIPRTLHMALSGLRELSIIATPPVDRLVVNSFVMPADPVILREAIMREYHRGGQIFYVCPKIQDQMQLSEQLRTLVPEVKTAIANGQMPAKGLDTVMQAFYDREVDLLLSTNIIESGLDIPAANTIIIHRADMFGLSQLYQMRGRVGRGKLRGYAYFTTPPHRIIGETSQRRLEVIQSLDQLGAGFQLASQDLDIRGAGNLLGDDQSGHIKEVGYELYNSMLKEAVAAAKARARAADDGEDATPESAGFSPQISLDSPSLIPEQYIPDLALRLSFYRRLASLEDLDALNACAVEMVDRFGPLPSETENLIEILEIKQRCRQAMISKVEAGPKGIVLTFHNNTFTHPARLIDFLSQSSGSLTLRADHKLVWQRTTKDQDERRKKAKALVNRIAKLAA